MNRFRKFSFVFVLCELILLLAVNLFAFRVLRQDTGSQYKVDISRMVGRLEQGEALERISLTDYPTIVAVHAFDATEEADYKYAYCVRSVQGDLLCFEYEENKTERVIKVINITFGSMIFVSILLLLYLNQKLIVPFSKMNHLTQELAKGNLSVPIQQEKSKYFGQFLWGMDMLRETLEDNKKRELALLKERKTLILSISHDIKTPLSAIDLYTKALKHDLYETQKERDEALSGIEKNTVEIKNYVKQITEATREDFLSLEVEKGEVYLAKVFSAIKDYYQEKMKRLHISFSIEPFENCLILADLDRTVEVLQNLIENAIKYGDGREITILVSEEEECKLITVRNTGASLSSEELPHLFDSFYRGGNAVAAEGSGLGLYICKELMHLMDGEIYAKICENQFFMTCVFQKI